MSSQGRHRRHRAASTWVEAWRAVKRWHHRFWAWYRGLYRGKPWYVKTLVAIATAIVTFVLYLIAVDVNFLWLFGKSPSLSDIMNPKTANASYIYSCDGKLIGKYFNENRTPVKYDEINPAFYTLLIDTEDERFYDHLGIDFPGLAAAVKDIVVHGKRRGGSTITQQLVKNMFRVRTKYSTGLLGYIPGVRILIMKTKEWILATEIEVIYRDKERILEMYANTVDFGNNAFGIKTAAKVYFNTTPDKLTVDQCATLVGILKGTTVYNPRRNPEKSRSRRNTVLHNSLVHNHLTQEQYDRFSALPLKLEYSPEEEFDGQASYFRQAVARQMREWCEENGVDFYTDGLEIHTTLDSRMQQCAEQAVTQHMRQLQNNFNSQWGGNPCWTDKDGRVIPHFVEEKARRSAVYKQLMAQYESYDSVLYYMNKPRKMRLFDYNGGHEATMSPLDSIKYMLHFMHCGLVAIDPASREVKAWVGDVDFKTWKYDNVLAQHQPGSTFKALVYAAAMQRGLRPCDSRLDAPFDTMLMNPASRMVEKWAPRNANGRTTGAPVTLRAAFARSINTVAVNVTREIGVETVVATAQDMGITTELDPQISISLGASDVRLFDLVNAYCTIVNDGMAQEPIVVNRIVAKDDRGRKKELYNSNNDRGAEHRALSHTAAYYMLKLLQAGITDAGGTSAGLRAYLPEGMDAGGKTGTTNEHSDAWFVGVTPRLVCGAWVGGEYRQIHFKDMHSGQGSRAALPMVGLFLQKVLNTQGFSSLRSKFKTDAYLDRAAMLCSDIPGEKQPENDSSDNTSAIDTMAAFNLGDEDEKELNSLDRIPDDLKGHDELPPVKDPQDRESQIRVNEAMKKNYNQ